MPKAKDIRIQGISFEEGLRRMLGTPAPPVQKPAPKRGKKAGGKSAKKP